MNQSKGSKIFKKGRASQENSAIKNSNYNSKIKVQGSERKNGVDSLQDQNWIGNAQKNQYSPMQTQRKQQLAMTDKNGKKVNPFDVLGSAMGGGSKPTGGTVMSGSVAKSTTSPQKAPAQLIQDILKGLSSNSFTEVNPYYSQQSQQRLAQILTNKNKLNSYISELQNEMFSVDSNVVKNYEILIVLLKQLGNSDVEIKKNAKGIEIGFNKGSINKQQNEIEKLQKNLKQKEDQVKEIVQEYESVIRNFNDVIEKLLEEREGMENFGKLNFK